jgi:hypothetical protein
MIIGNRFEHRITIIIKIIIVAVSPGCVIVFTRVIILLVSRENLWNLLIFSYFSCGNALTASRGVYVFERTTLRNGRRNRQRVRKGDDHRAPIPVCYATDDERAPTTATGPRESWFRGVGRET